MNLMIILWSALSFMLLLALSLIWLPFYRACRLREADTKLDPALIYKQDLINLDRDYNNSLIDKTEYQRESDRLKLKLWEELNLRSTIQNTNQRQPAWYYSVLISIVFIIIAIGSYWLWGNSKALQQLWQQQTIDQQTQAMMAEFNNTEAIVAALKQRLASTPNSAKGWYLLGRIYLAEQQYAEAEIALAKANALKPNSPKIMTDYAQALFFINKRRLNTIARQLLQITLSRDPNNIDALNLLAIDAYNAKQYQQAIHYWKILLPILEGHPDEQKTIMQMLAKARQQMK